LRLARGIHAPYSQAMSEDLFASPTRAGTDYDAHTVVLEGLEPVRRRPGGAPLEITTSLT